MNKINLEEIAKSLMKAIIDTGIKDNCRVSPEFRKAFIDDMKENGYSNLITLTEYIIDN